MKRVFCLTRGAPAAVIVMLVLSMVSFIAAQSEYADIRIDRLGGTVTLNCSSESEQYAENPFNGSSPVAWMLPAPGLRMVSESEPKYTISTDNWTITIINTNETDLGQYHCMFYNASAPAPWYLVKVGLNVRGPYFDVLWDKYEIPTIIGISALFGFLLLALVVILIYHFRYIPNPEPDQTGLMAQETSAFGYKAADVDTGVHDEHIPAQSYENKGFDKGAEADEAGGGSSGVSSAADKDDEPTYSEVTTKSRDMHEMTTSDKVGADVDDDHDSESATAL